MKRSLFLLGLAVFLLALSEGHGGPVVPIPVDSKASLAPLTSQFYTAEFKGGQRATVLVLGNGASHLGLYVYDAHGNCIAWDDEGNYKIVDDLAVNWEPRVNAMYTIQIHNGGFAKNFHFQPGRWSKSGGVHLR